MPSGRRRTGPVVLLTRYRQSILSNHRYLPRRQPWPVPVRTIQVFLLRGVPAQLAVFGGAAGSPCPLLTWAHGEGLAWTGGSPNRSDRPRGFRTCAGRVTSPISGRLGHRGHRQTPRPACRLLSVAPGRATRRRHASSPSSCCCGAAQPRRAGLRRVQRARLRGHRRPSSAPRRSAPDPLAWSQANRAILEAATGRPTGARTLHLTRMATWLLVALVVLVVPRPTATESRLPADAEGLV